ncbi:hypothetical protein [Oculatella sp. LEGE 06141]|nr:hypothetical protein [Oculatella sp. LEGE 06141]
MAASGIEPEFNVSWTRSPQTPAILSMAIQLVFGGMSNSSK